MCLFLFNNLHGTRYVSYFTGQRASKCRLRRIATTTVIIDTTTMVISCEIRDPVHQPESVLLAPFIVVTSSGIGVGVTYGLRVTGVGVAPV